MTVFPVECVEGSKWGTEEFATVYGKNAGFIKLHTNYRFQKNDVVKVTINDSSLYTFDVEAELANGYTVGSTK